MVVTLVATGGTISSTASDQGAQMTKTGAELLVQARIRGAVDSIDWRTAGSFTLSVLDMLDLAVRCQAVLDGGADGLVVTHGTDSMEETAFAMALVLGARGRVVLTGAQRSFDDPAPDGPHNLRAAFAMARCAGPWELGPLVAFDGQGYQARGIRKVETLRTAAFDAPGRGPVMSVWGGVPRLLSRGHVVRPLRGLLEALVSPPAHEPFVPVVPMLPGSNGTALRAVLAAKPAAVVLQAMGSGNAAPEDVEIASRLATDGLPVLVTSRVPRGAVRPIYADAGAKLAQNGALFCDDLSPWQARVLASACVIANPTDPLSAASHWLTSDHP
jgi:L-asparaginase